MLTDMQIPIIPVSDGTTQRLIANIQENTVANKDYYTGDQFILNGVLYRVTKANGGTLVSPTPAIPQGTTIDIANDCVVSDTIAQQLTGVDVSSDIDTTDINTVYYAVRFGNLICFSVYTNNISVGVNGHTTISCFNTIRPKQYTAVQAVPGLDTDPPIGCLITTNGTLFLRSPNGVAITNKAYFVSGCFVSAQ